MENIKCFWCDKICDPDYSLKDEDGETHFFCSDGCKRKSEKFLQHEKRSMVIFLVLILACIGALLFGSMINPKIFCSIPMSAMGFVILIFPFCTPQTVQLVGLKKSIIIGHCLGILVILLGIFFYFFI